MSSHTTMAQTGKSNASIADLAWIVGRWKTEGASEFEEHWMPASNHLMLGMCRLIKENQVKMLEVCTIEQESDSIIFRMRHFTRTLNPWEEEPLTLRLTRWNECEAVFENVDNASRLDQLIYRKTGKNAMTVHVGKSDSGSLEVHFKRQH